MVRYPNSKLVKAILAAVEENTTVLVTDTGDTPRRKPKSAFCYSKPVALDVCRRLVDYPLSLHLWLSLVAESSMRQSLTVKLRRKVFERVGITTRQRRRCIDALVAAGFVRIVRDGRGRCYVIEVLSTPLE